MKKVTCFIVVLMVVMFGFSLGFAQTNQQIRITWGDDNEKSDDFRWLLFMRGDGEGFGAPVVTIPISGTTSDGSYISSPAAITISGSPGSIVTKYFALRSQKGTGAQEITSGMSPEVSKSFPIPLSAPYSVTIEIVIVPE